MSGKLKYLRWVENPHCHYCGILTRWHPFTKKLKPPLDAATKEHLISRNDPSYMKGMTREWVIACLGCNTQRGLIEDELARFKQRLLRDYIILDQGEGPTRADSIEPVGCP